MDTVNKPAIALIIPGGIGTGHNNIGVPVLERMVKLLSLQFNITVFQLYPVNDGYTPAGFALLSIHASTPLMRMVRTMLLFARVHRRKKFQAVHGFWILPSGFLAVLLGRMFGIKSIVSVLGGDAIALPDIGYGQLRSPFYRWISRQTIRFADEVMALTQYLVDNLVRCGIHRPSIRVVPWGIDTSLFRFAPKAMGDPVRFLHVANLHPVKDPITLIRTFDKIRRATAAHLTIIGEGVLEADVKRLVNDLHLAGDVTFLGLQPYESLVEYYHAADILLHTSRSEGQSEVVTEAMSCGLIVCGTRVGLLYDVPDGCVAVPVQDYTTLADQTLALLRDPARVDDVRARAYTWASKHTIWWTVEQTAALYTTR